MNQLFGDIGHYKLLNCLYLLRMFGKFCKVIMKISKLWENPFKPLTALDVHICIGYSASYSQNFKKLRAFDRGEK